MRERLPSLLEVIVNEALKEMLNVVHLWTALYYYGEELEEDGEHN